MFFEAIILIFAFLFLAISSYFLVASLEKISWFLGLKKFVIGFLVMGLAVSLPNIFIAIYSANLAIPMLSLGEIFGGNIFLLTLALGVITLISKNGLNLKSALIKKASIYTLLISIFLLFLTLDSNLSRIDGIILISIFLIYFFWIFAKKERFSSTYDKKVKIIEFIKSLTVFLFSLLILLVSTFFIVNTSIFFANEIGISFWFIGLFIVGFFGALPEVVFGIHAAKAKESELVIGNLIGSSFGGLTLVLGILILFYPIEFDFQQLFPVQIFIIISAALFFYFGQTKNKISQKEGYILISAYLLFLLSQALILFL